MSARGLTRGIINMFHNKVVVVTGGTKGIGKSIVVEFLKRNADVVVIYSTDDASAKQLEESFRMSQRRKLFFYKGTILDVNFLKMVFRDIEAHFGKLDVLVNNAGINKDSLFLDMDQQDWEKVITTNIKGTLNSCLLASDLMKKSSFASHIVNISSISGIFGRSAQANYSCSKGAIIGMTKLLAKKFAHYPIFVNTVVPGLIRTEMAGNMPEDKINEIINATILRRIGEPDEIAKVVVSLVSGDFSYVSGTCIKVDGGYSR